MEDVNDISCWKQVCGVCGSKHLRVHIKAYDGIRILICDNCQNRILLSSIAPKGKDDYDGLSINDY